MTELGLLLVAVMFTLILLTGAALVGYYAGRGK
jgi:hypothetical protein